MPEVAAVPPIWPPKMAVCVGAVVLQGERVLFVRQAAGASLAGQWSIPWGLVDAEEAPEQAALRETREESGIQAELVGLLGVQNLPRAGWLGLIFLCRHVGANTATGAPTPDGVETDRAAYFTLEELAAGSEPFEPWCAWLAQRVLRGEHHLIPLTPAHPYSPRVAFL